MPVKALEPAQLCQRCDPAQFDFKTTEDLEHLADFIGQPRAIEALEFGVGIRQKGYNIFAFGPEGIGKENLVRKTFEAAAASERVPSDWCYVQNFEQPHKPRALELPAGKGSEFKRDMEQFVDDLQNVLPITFESEEYRNRLQEVQEALNEQQEAALGELRARAEQVGLAVLRTPAGLAIAPVRDGEVISPEEFQGMPSEQREELEKDITDLQEELEKMLMNVPGWQRELREQITDLNREMADIAVGGLIRQLVEKYAESSGIVEHLEAVQLDVVRHVREITDEGDTSQISDRPSSRGPLAALAAGGARSTLRRYQVNLLVDHGSSEGAPVIYEDNPTFQNLLGRIEHTTQLGALITDFNLIKPGALHRANDGYLILDARKLFQEPFAWEGLKRALRSEQLRMETPGQVQSFISTVTLDPEPIPLKAKVALLGEPLLYYLLMEHDPESRELFRVASDFDDQMDRDSESQMLYARLIGSLATVHDLRPLDPGGVARVIEHSSRIVSDGRKLSIQMNHITDLMREANYWAGESGREIVTTEDVSKAIDAQIYRSDRIRERFQEQIHRKTVLIDTAGAQVGQVNGLSVYQFGDFAFGRPSRITARVRMGKGEVLDIEREVELGGPIHSKGVLILSSFLGSRYSVDRQLSLSASLVFEQSYGGIEGDSASSAELYALLSSLADVPVKQSLAVTGSVDQYGRVQAIGGVNEKIEGFFDICQTRGLDGNHGVLIPDSNVQHLMLRDDVVQAVAEGKFHVYPIETIDQGIELLTDMPAGEPDEEGSCPENTVNGKVRARLAGFAEEAESGKARQDDDSEGDQAEDKSGEEKNEGGSES
ncbi:MAG: ATP-binding protein [Anaerolineae bacterium]|nr:MAG: ATP-binding protein [Anaerolineae bacterium]